MRGITIICNNKKLHTGNDLDLVQEQKTIGSPGVQSYTVEVPGRNGPLVLTKALTGRLCYNSREISLQYFGSGTRDELLRIKKTLLEFHGENVMIIDDDTPDYYYEGEISIAPTLYGNYITLEITVTAQPFALAINPTVITYSLGSSKTIEIYNEGMPVNPQAIVTGSAVISDGESSYNLNNGTYNLSDITLDSGFNTLTVSGSGLLQIVYREAVL